MSVSLESPIPSGEWTLYWHSSEGRDWTPRSFTNFGSMKLWKDFFAVTKKLTPDALSDGMFFLMRDPIPPLWENCANVYGGAYSFRIVKREAGEAFILYAIAMMMETITTDKANKVNGMSISPKKPHTYNIIKIWNTDSATYKKPADLLKLIPEMKTEDILYTLFTDKKM